MQKEFFWNKNSGSARQKLGDKVPWSADCARLLLCLSSDHYQRKTLSCPKIGLH